MPDPRDFLPPPPWEGPPIPRRIRYHYTVMMASWAHTPKEFNKLKKWAAETQKGYWWNFMSGPLEMFAFWAYPGDLLHKLEELGVWTSNFKIDVGYDALPETER